MKVVAFSFFLFLNLTVSAQLWVDFRVSIYQCIDSFYTKNPVKHKEITGITIDTDLEGNLTSFSIRFIDSSIELSTCEYNWLFSLLDRENYKKYENIFYSEEEIKGLTELKHIDQYLGGFLNLGGKMDTKSNYVNEREAHERHFLFTTDINFDIEQKLRNYPKVDVGADFFDRQRYSEDRILKHRERAYVIGKERLPISNLRVIIPGSIQEYKRGLNEK